MNPISVAWFLCAFVLFIYFARVLIADLRGADGGHSWTGELCDDPKCCEVVDA